MWRRNAVRAWWLGVVVPLFAVSLASDARAVPVTIEINDITLNDVDHNIDSAATLYRYFVSNVVIAGQFVSVTGRDQVGVCSLAQPVDNASGCFNRINPAPGAWRFTADVPQTTGTITALIQVRDTNASKLTPLDLSPGGNAFSSAGLGLLIDLDTRTWTLRDGSGASPVSASSSFIGAIDPNQLTGSVGFSVGFCDPSSSEVLNNGLDDDCDGSVDECNASQLGQTIACTTSVGSCSNLPGERTCTAAEQPPGSCVPFELDELLNNGLDDDCDGRVDECNADHLGETIACTAPLGTCASQPGVRVCQTAEQPPGACAPFDDGQTCLPRCATEIHVTNVAELRDAVAQAGGNDCKDVIVLAPGEYDLTAQQLDINDSLELRGEGTSFGCEGLSPDDFGAMSVSPDLSAVRCDGDAGEDPRATVLVTRKRPASVAEQENVFGRVLQIGRDDDPATPISNEAAYPEVTLRHLAVRGGFSLRGTSGDEGLGILSYASRLELYNVVVERNIAQAPGAGIHHSAPAGTDDAKPTFIMVNSTIQDNRNTVAGAGGIGLQGDGGGIRLYGGHSFILRSTIAYNAAIRGSGISAHSSLSIHNSTISGNIAGDQGGGIWLDNLPSQGSLLELYYSTVTNNVAEWSIWNGPLLAGPGITTRGNVTTQLLGSVVAGNLTCRGDGISASQPVENSNIETILSTDCISVDGSGGTFESLGGNLAGQGCGLQPSFPLPSGATAHDRILDLRSSSFLNPDSEYQLALVAFCHAGISHRDVIPGDNLNPDLTQHTGPVPPPSASSLFDGNDVIQFLSPLADNGGPTHTHGLPSNSVAVGASATLADPGDIADGFASTTPVCPRADQRGFAPALGERLETCDAGAFQSLNIAAFSADSLANQLSALSADSDGDGFADEIDIEPGEPSLLFSDVARGGVTQGEVVDVGDQVLRVFDLLPNPDEGVVVMGLSAGGGAPAAIVACDGTQHLFVGAGQIQVIHCPQQPPVCVLAMEQLTIMDRAELALDGLFGDRVTIGADGQITGAVYASSNVTLQHSSIDGDVRASGDVSGAESSSVTGAIAEGAYVLPRALQIRTVAFGTAPITIDHDQVGSLAPGAYGALWVKDRGRLSLSSGRYSFSSITLGNQARLIVQGQLTIESQGNVSVADGVSLLSASSAPASGNFIDWYTNGQQVFIGQDVHWAGTLVAPLANVTVSDRTSVDGCLGGRNVTLGHDTLTVTSRQLSTTVEQLEANATTPPPGGVCNESTATDLGSPGQETSVPADGCVRIKDGYPGWWGVRSMKVEPTSGQYPVPFAWSNSCGVSSGSGAFAASWQGRSLPAVSSSCATIIDLQGPGSGSITLRYWSE